MSIRPTLEQGQRTIPGECQSRTAASRLGRVWLLSSFVLLFLAACSSQNVGTWGDDAITLLVKESPASTASSSLESQTVSGRISIVAETSLTVTEIEFYLDDVDFVGSPVAVDADAPFELDLDTASLSDGEHTVSVLVTVDEGGADATRFRHARFAVRNSSKGTSPTSPDPSSFGEFSLRGDPSFDESQLSSEARLWYRRVWSAIEHPDQRLRGNLESGSGSLRHYGYAFQQYMLMVVTAYRATGDLLLLDEIVRLSDRMAGALTTHWYDATTWDPYTPTDGTAGYRRWVYIRPNDTHHRVGKDTDRISVYKTHAYIALVAYMLDLNRDLVSPSGHDYGERADFWRDYLVNDFEAIQYIRRGKSQPEDIFRYSDNVGMSVLHSQLTYHHYMHKLTGESARLKHADKEAAAVAGGMFVTDTSVGDAVVFGKPRDPASGLVPIAYSRYTWALHVDIVLDGHPLFSDPAYMEMHARTLSHFVMDNGSQDFAFDVGGMEDRTGVSWGDGSTVATLPTQNPYTSSSLTWGREDSARFALGYYTPLAAFGEPSVREEIVTVSKDVHHAQESDVENPRHLAISVGMLLAHASR